MKTRLRFRWLSPEESPLGMKAIDTLWRQGHILARDEALFRWQYAWGRVPGALGFLVAEDNGCVVGFSGMLCLPWHLYGKPLSGGVGAITVIAPEYREAACGLAMMAEVDRDLAIVGSFGINRRVARLYQLQGRYVAEAFPRRLGICPGPALDAYLSAFNYPESRQREIRQNCGRLRRKALPPQYRPEQLTYGNLAEWDGVWHSDFAPRLIGVARNGKYVRWRYLEHPRFDYSCLILRDNAQKICGMAVFRIMDLKCGASAMRILDFLAADEDSASALAAAIVENLPRDSAYVEFFAPGRQGNALGQIGLSEAGSDLISVYTSPPDPAHCAILSALRVNLPDFTPCEFAEHRDVYFTIADGDQDRPN